MAAAELLFPYMHWAHGEAFASPYSLSQSGMPPPDMSLLGELSGSDLLGYPAATAQPDLEARIAEFFGVSSGRVLATSGASGAMLICALRWFRGARVLIDRPSYEPFRALPALVGAHGEDLPRHLDRAWSLDPGQVRARVQELRGQPTHLFLSNPNNPTGAVLGAEGVHELAASAAESGGVLVCNEAYMEYGQPEERVHAACLHPQAVSIGTLSKAYGLGPLRIGWIVLGEELAAQGERERLLDLAYLTTLEPPTASMVAARRALDRLPELLQPVRRIEAESRPHLWRWLGETEGVESLVPPFGILAFPRIEGVPDTRTFARWLAETHAVDVVPGEFFGMAGHLRLGCAVPEATLSEGLARLSQGLEEWRSGSGPALARQDPAR